MLTNGAITINSTAVLIGPRRNREFHEVLNESKASNETYSCIMKSVHVLAETGVESTQHLLQQGRLEMILKDTKSF